MANINLVRIDLRMVHGQVAVKWSSAAKINKIVCVDNQSTENEILKTIYKMAAPPGTKVLVYSQEKCVEKWKECQFNDGNVMVLFKDVKSCYETYKAGFPISTLQLGNAPKNEVKNISLSTEFSISEEELTLLKEMANDGVKVEIQSIPEKPCTPLEKAI